MFIYTDLLRAALCCVANQEDSRKILRGVHITPTHIQATNGVAAVSMKHDSRPEMEGVFILHGDIPASAEGTVFQQIGSQWIASHMDDYERPVGHNELELVEGKFPDLGKLLPTEEEPCSEFPIFAAELLALPYRMFGNEFTSMPVNFKLFGPEKPCQVLFNVAVNSFYGDPVLVIMPMKSTVFDLHRKAMQSKGETH
ncbi:hypothetical protein ACAY42_001158 [Citrobacter freundii]|uniref:hypothetical protein n=1 Tax=Citrobacter freundii complex TaxID=1344959 RepID=UPI000CDCEC38|nr:hypothetical protein [Citrobacter freundii complex sp. CFNIH12]EJG2199321.1 hypothetical protein [Citrobacter freundii]EKA7905671.1 hypothetical protein [Citrobacter freundii]EKV5430887.1 hypothetical protein [Citrobacter freundii]POU44103.1 hypothetical protein C3375_15885 [Citrobacter freundii complex sp. CFNIH12]HAT2188312.1 hypothetical protein [Citrobacter freundii]